jgi:hypothetical protein
LGIIVSAIQAAGEEIVDHEALEAQDRAHHVDNTLGHVVGHTWSYVTPFVSFLMAMDSP